MGSNGNHMYTSKIPNCSKNDYVRWKNCQGRNFTINGISILAFHEALVHQPRDPLVVATFALALYLGVDMLLAMDIGKSFNRQHDAGFSELLEPQVWDDKHLVTEVQGLVASVRWALTEMTDEYYVANAMAKIPRAPSSDLVFIPLQAYLKVLKLLVCVQHGKEHGYEPKSDGNIGYHNPSYGTSGEVRNGFTLVVFDTIYPSNLESQHD